MPEISDEQLVLFRKLEQLHNTLYTDEAEGLNFKQMLKRKFPKLSIPEIDAAAPHVAKLTDLEKRLDELKSERENEKLESSFSKQFTATKQEFNLTDEGMDQIRKLIKETHEKDGYVLSPRAAAALLIHEKPPKPLEPSGYGNQRWDFLSGDTEAEQKSIADLINDPDAWLEKQIPKILAEDRGKQRLPVGV